MCRPGDLVGAAVACGVAWSIHYYCVFLAVPLALTVVDARRARRVAGDGDDLALVLPDGRLVVFFALSPFLLVEPATAWRDIVANRQIVVDRATEPRAVRQPAAVPDAAGRRRDAAGRRAGAIGAVRLVVTDRRRALLLLSFPVPFLLFISNTVPASRYLNPVAAVRRAAGGADDPRYRVRAGLQRAGVR